MKTIKAYRKQVAKDVDDFLTNGPSLLAGLEKSLKESFPYDLDLCTAEKEFEKSIEANGFEATNSTLAKVIPEVRDVLAKGIENIMLLERFISIHVPAMEDGNNFGVSVQMVVAKYLKEIREAWIKKIEAIPSYYSSRAESIEKLGLPKVTKSETKTETDSSTAGGKDGDEKKSSSSATKEQKSTGNSKIDVHRSKHVVAIDLNHYVDLRATMIMVIDGYLTILDNMEKNKEKLSAPKGTSGGGSSMGMY